MPETTFQRKTQRMDCLGLDLNRPVDSVKPGRFPYLKNCRSYQAGRLEPRNGLTDIGIPVSSQNEVHSMRRLNDLLKNTWRRIVGAGTHLAIGTYTPNTPAFVDVDSGYSGNPLALVPWRPDQSPDAFMYVGDSLRMRKVKVDNTIDTIGYAPPTAVPEVKLADNPNYEVVDNFLTEDWVIQDPDPNDTNYYPNTLNGAFGPDTNGPNGHFTKTPLLLSSSPRPPGQTGTVGYRTLGHIQYILFDNPAAATGWCNITLDIMTDPSLMPANSLMSLPAIGQRILLSPNNETITVQAVYKGAGVSTLSQDTIQVLAILWDNLSGPGDCSVYLTAAVDMVDTDALIHNITTGELARILAVIQGPDGTSSIRLSTTTVWNQNDQVEILPSFRCWCANTHTAGSSSTAGSDGIRFEVHVVQITGTSNFVGMGWMDKTVNLDLSVVAPGVSSQPDDIMAISVRIDHPELLVELKVQLDVDAKLNDFRQNYYTRSFRASDLSAAFTASGSAISSRGTTLQNQIVSNQITPTNNQSPLPQPATPSTSNATVSQQLKTGNTVWSAMAFRLSELTRIGTDASRTLANVKKLRIQAQVVGTALTDILRIDVDSWWIGGGYGPDTLDATTIPYLYRYRVRNPLTGVMSNPSPASRNGQYPRRQEIVVTPTVYEPPPNTVQAGILKLDIERFGGSIAAWHYVGSVPNVSGFDGGFLDKMPDDIAATLDDLGEDRWQPWPIIDVARSGMGVAAAGTSLQDANASFDLRWAPGTQIQIGPTVYTIYRILSTSLLEVTSNIGALTAPAWTVPEPTLMGQPLYAMWGDEQLGSFFACGDPINPGRLYFSNGNNPDNTTEGYYLDVTSPSEPLMNGVVYNLRSYVFSSERMFQIMKTGNVQIPWVAQEIPNGKGLFARWAITREPAPLIAILGKDGIYSTTGGAPFPLTDAELYPLLPNEGNPGEDTNGVLAPMISADTERLLRLTYYDEFLYFDYPLAIPAPPPPPPPPPPAPLAITTTTLPDATIGVAYSATLQASGGTPPYTWGAVPASDGSSLLPPGLVISPAGVISGTPTATGHFGFSVLLTDSATATTSTALSITSVEPGGGVGLLQITTAPTLKTAQVGTPYSLALSASGGTAPYHWAATSPLPAGLTLSAGGIISGTPTTPTTTGTQSFTITLVDSSTPTSQQVSQTFTLVVSALPPLTITTASLPDGTVGSPYSVTLAATGGLAPYSWALASGNALPAGLTLSATGIISGTPTAITALAGFTVVVFDSASESATKGFQFTISAAGGPLNVTTPTPPNGTTGTSYSFTIGVTGGLPPYTFSIVSGDQLPAGLSLSANGVITGTPTAAGSFSFGVAVNDSQGQGTSVRFAMTVISPVPPTITTPTLLPSATVNAVYSLQFAATSGTPPYTWQAASTLPPGFTISSSGLLSGTPTAAGTNSFSVRVTDNAGLSTVAGFSLTVNSPGSLTITTTSLPVGTVGSPYSTTLGASGGTLPYTWSLVTVNGLPGGLNMNAAGTISGTPSGFGLFTFTVEVRDNTGLTSSAQFSISIQNAGIALTITTASPLPNATLGVFYSQQLSAIGGVPPYTWSGGGTPPDFIGLTISASGLVSGIPSRTAYTSFSAVVTDNVGTVAATFFFITIVAAGRSAAPAPDPRKGNLGDAPPERVRAAGVGMATLILATDVGATERGSAPGGWFWDVYTQQILMHYGEEGPGVHALLMGGGDSHLYGYSGCDDAGVAFPMEFTTPSDDGGDPRSIKLYQDIMLDANTDTLDAQVTAYADNNKTALVATTINTGTERAQVSIPLGSTPPLTRDMSAIEARNISLNVVVMVTQCRRPHFYIYEPRWADAAAPLASGAWEISATSSGLPNWKWFGIFRISYVSAGPVDVDIWLDPGGRQPTITLPSSGGEYHMEVFRVPVYKFKLWRVRVAAATTGTTSTNVTLRLDTRDSFIEIKEWGSNDAYRHFRVLDEYALVEG